jgi:nucleoside-diphosphate-sugar epimerase
MDIPARSCAVTGASGYVGSRLCEHFVKRGWNVFALSRRRSDCSGGPVHVPFQFDGLISSEVFRRNGIQVLVHCAYDFGPRKWEEIRRINVEGSTRLLRAAKEGGVQTIIVISSISAFEGCQSLYGRAKLELEKIGTEFGAGIIRPGLVYGKHASGGMFGALQKSVRKSAIVPLIGSGRQVQYLVHEEDLSELIFKVSSGEIKLPRKPVVAASPRAWPVRELLAVMASAQGARILFFPVPWRCVWLGLKAAETCGVHLPFRSDSVVSLIRQDPSPDFSFAAEYDGFRKFSASALEPAAGS